MTTNKAWGAGIGAAIGSAIVAGLGSYLGHPLDAYTTAAILGAISWIATYFTPKNATA